MTGILMMSVGNSYGSLPINTVAPVVSGTATVGQTLSTTNGTWTAAPAITGYTYQWQRGVSDIGGATSSTYVLVSADAGNTVRCVVTATNAVGATSANSNSTATVVAVTGQAAYTSPGTYTFVIPAGVTSISAVAVGGGAAGGGGGIGGSGGGLSYNNNYAVTPGDSWFVIAPSSGNTARLSTSTSFPYGTKIVEATGGTAFFPNGAGTGTAGGSSVSRTGGQGGNSSSTAYTGGGGGAAGYSGNGGNGYNQSSATAGTSGSGGGGAGGGAAQAYFNALGKDFLPRGQSGGGVGILGEGSSGTYNNSGPGAGGSGGSGGSTPNYSTPSSPGVYGGGSSSSSVSGGIGAVRIIWPGNTRQFPSTNTGNL